MDKDNASVRAILNQWFANVDCLIPEPGFVAQHIIATVQRNAI
jgi:hypothetical protein